MNEFEIARFASRFEAELLLARLEVAGIAGRLVGDDCGGVDPALSFTNGCRVLVDADDAIRAREVEAMPESEQLFGLTIGLEKSLDFDQIAPSLRRLFDDAEVAEARPEQEALPEAAVTVQVDPHASEFSTVLTFWQLPSTDPDLEPALAAALARAFDCRAICDGSAHAPREPEGPYWSLVTNGTIFWLADDRDSAWADGDGGAVRLLETIDLEVGALE